MGHHLIDGEFQSDKYPTTPRGKVPLSVRDESAQDLLWEYARRRRVVDAEFSDDLEAALRAIGSSPPGRLRDLFPPAADQLRDLFARHCECRPVNTARTSHSHDCDTGYTDHVRTAIHRIVVERHGDGEVVRAASDVEVARARICCASLLGDAVSDPPLPLPRVTSAGRLLDALTEALPEIAFDDGAASSSPASSSEYVDGYADARSIAIAAMEVIDDDREARVTVVERDLSYAHAALDTIGRAAGVHLFPDGSDLDRDAATSVAAAVSSICTWVSQSSGRSTSLPAVASSIEQWAVSPRESRPVRSRTAGEISPDEMTNIVSRVRASSAGKDRSGRVDRQDDVRKSPAARALLKIANHRPCAVEISLERIAKIAGSRAAALSLVSGMVTDDVVLVSGPSGDDLLSLTLVGARAVNLIRDSSRDLSKREIVDLEIRRLLGSSLRSGDPDPGKIGQRDKKRRGARRS